MNNQEQSWKEMSSLFKKLNTELELNLSDTKIGQLSSVISQEIQKAKEQERERVLGLIGENILQNYDEELGTYDFDGIGTFVLNELRQQITKKGNNN